MTAVAAPALRDPREWSRGALAGVLVLAACLLYWGVWWGWPSSYDQHDPTRRAIRMLWERSLDPGIRYWGAFAYQEVLLLAVAPAALVKKLLGLDPELAVALSYLMTRILWATKALVMVGLGYLSAVALFGDRRAGVLAALFMALAPGFVAWAHIPQVDIAHAFWFTMVLWLTAEGWRRASGRWLAGAAVAAGLAAGVKYVGGVAVLGPVLAGCLLYRPGRAAAAAAGLLATAAGVFALTTPLASGDPLQWLPEYTADVLANSQREVDAPLAFWTLPGAMAELFGPAFAMLGLVSLAGIRPRRADGGGAQPWWLLAAAFVPYYLALGWQHVSTVRYVLPLVAVVAVAVGALSSRLLDRAALRPLVLGALALAVPVQLALVLGLAVGFATETRDRLARWMAVHAGPDDRVETLLDHRPYFSGPVAFDVQRRPHFQAETAQMQRNIREDRDSAVRGLHERFMAWAGVDDSQVRTWVDKERDWLAGKAESYDTGVGGPAARGARYVVVNRNTAAHYVLDWPGVDPLSPAEKEFFQAVISERGPFVRRARFEPRVPDWLRHPRELWINISPPIEVYEVVAPGASGAGAGGVGS